MRKKISIAAAILGLLLGLAACRGATTPDGPDMTGLWLLPFGGGTMASLTQSGDTISGFAHVADSMTTCWSSSDRLAVHGTIASGGSVRMTLGGAFPVEMTGVLSADGEVLNNVGSISRSCNIEGYPWQETASEPGIRIHSLTGTYEFRFEAGGTVRTFTASLTHSLTIGPDGGMPVTVTATMGADWPCGPVAVTGHDFFLKGYRLRGALSLPTVPDFMWVETYPVSTGSSEFQGTFGGSWDPGSLACIEGFTAGTVTIKKR